ncbi:nuclear transport factor 2 family protein [Amycolatopsis thermophila]|uniref:Ketosteroid isomerase-like protein n=1 Tax=Amycolatopsis thermophila TaxID=206084 RepID=A0ABU0EX54_9PSEU|nr:nuclear transport factor 2 family protein [Amycolatopsis thermophila]MDQ0379905.1 ketosteroid isomerase-like protein [Amycolatopsis thermophila]
MTIALPEVITSYLAAHSSRDTETALGRFTDDATVTDEGHIHRGPAEIRDWLQRAGGGYTYTTTLIATERVDDDHYVATHRLEGDFPGNVVDLRYRFTLREGRIAALVIEP